MRLVVLSLLLAAASTPAVAGENGGFEGYYAPSSPHQGRTFVDFGHDDRWGPRVFSRDDGYFQGRGGGVSTMNGKAVFEYDRDYPFDFPSRWGAREDGFGFVGEDERPEPACQIVAVPDRRSGGSADVRVCR